MSKAKKNLIILAIGVISIVLFNKYLADPTYNYDQVGYLKLGHDRVLTFNTDAPLKEIKEHGNKLMHTEGAITRGYYYRDGAPDITLLQSLGAAFPICIDAKPIATMAIHTNGTKEIFYEKPIKRPETDEQRLFLDIVDIQDKSQADADKKYPVDASDPNYKKENVSENIDLQRELEAQAIKRLISKHGVTEDSLNKLKVQGVINNWLDLTR